MENPGKSRQRKYNKQLSAFRIASLFLGTIVVLVFYVYNKQNAVSQSGLQCHFLVHLQSDIEYLQQSPTHYASFSATVKKQLDKKKSACQKMINRLYKIQVALKNDTIKMLMHKQDIALLFKINTSPGLSGIKPAFSWILSKEFN